MRQRVPALAPEGEWPEVMTAELARDYLGISRNTMYDKLRTGVIPGWKCGGEWRIAKAELDKRLRPEDEKSFKVPDATSQYQALPISVPNATK